MRLCKKMVIYKLIPEKWDMNNNKVTSVQHGQHTRNGYMLLLGLMVALACVLVMAVRIVLAAPTYAGPITVTANMGSFSPNLVLVNNSATSSLSAYYIPPSGIPEGQLSASYDWSVSQVQYKALQADTFGSPSANSYTDSISLPMRRTRSAFPGR